MKWWGFNKWLEVEVLSVDLRLVLFGEICGFRGRLVKATLLLLIKWIEDLTDFGSGRCISLLSLLGKINVLRQ